MRVSVVHNQAAGRGVLSRPQLVRALERAGHEVGRDGEVVIVAGGDGTITREANRLVEQRTPLLALPVGTANNVARSLGYDHTNRPIEYVLDTLARHEERDFDVGVSRTRYGRKLFYEGAGVGLFADALEILTEADKEPAHAASRLCEQLRAYPALPIEVVVDGTDHSGAYVMVDVMNVAHFGPRLHLTPDARRFDGLFDVALVSDKQRSSLTSYLLALGRGEEPSSPPVPVVRAAKVQLRLHGKKLRLDGRLHPTSEVSGAHRIELEVLRGALRVWLPRSRTTEAANS